MRAIKDNGLPKDVSFLNLKLVTPLQGSRDFCKCD